jgi:ABC-type nitrate/sulfonate/bicarbonate transport system ATPase subunit
MSATYTYTRGDVLFTLEDVSASYDGGRTPVLRDVNVQIRDLLRPDSTHGQIVGLVGPSGIGKSTLFRVITGLMRPDRGRVLIGPEQQPARPGMVGEVTQSYVVFYHRTIYDNLRVAASKGGYSRSDAEAKIKEYLAYFGLAGTEDRYPKQLSGGQRQRLAIARQLLASGRYLIMDEPFSGLDVINKEAVSKLISETTNTHEHNTVIVVTHELDAAVSICDTIWFMGRDRDEHGNLIPGARIKDEHTLCLLDRGLAWRPDIRTLPAFQETLAEMFTVFRTL